MYREHVVAAVVPAFNEESHIADVITTMPAVVDHIIVVDDVSSDGTAAAARACDDPRLEVITHDTNKGVGGSIITAHRRALELGSDINVVFAGDGQMDPAHLTDLVDPLIDEGVGYAKGNRFYSIGSWEGMPRSRVFGNVVLSFLTKAASGYWNLFDPSNGYTAITRQALESINLDSIAERYDFETDMLINLNIVDTAAADVPIPARYGSEVSTLKIRKVIPPLLARLFSGFWRRIMLKYVIRSFSPIALFLFLGLAMVTWGVGFGIWVITQTLGAATASTGTVILSVIPFLIGVQFLTSALVLDIQASPDRPMRAGRTTKR